MSKKIIVLIVSIFFLNLALVSTNTIAISKNKESNSCEIIPGYLVNDPDKIGKIGAYSQKLSQENYGTEIIEKRTNTSRHFQGPNGITTAIISMSETSYQDKDLKWCDIDEPVGNNRPHETTLYGTICDYESDEQEPYYWIFEKSVVGDFLPSMVGQDLDEQDTILTPYTESADPTYEVVENNHYHAKEIWRSFIQWDISSIPDTTNVYNVSIGSGQNDYVNDYAITFHSSDDAYGNGHNRFDSFSCNLEIRELSVDLRDYKLEQNDERLQDGKSQDLFNVCKQGKLYKEIYIETSESLDNCRKTIKHLNSDAVDDLKEKLVDDYFSVCFTSSDENIDGGITLYGGRPDLIVEYNTVPELYDGSVTPTKGGPDTVFEFQVTYRDLDGDGNYAYPVGWLWMQNGNEFYYTDESGHERLSDTTWRIDFRVQGELLPKGSYNYYFAAMDVYGSEGVSRLYGDGFERSVNKLMPNIIIEKLLNLFPRFSEIINNLFF